MTARHSPSVRLRRLRRISEGVSHVNISQADNLMPPGSRLSAVDPSSHNRHAVWGSLVIISMATSTSAATAVISARLRRLSPLIRQTSKSIKCQQTTVLMISCPKLTILLPRDAMLARYAIVLCLFVTSRSSISKYLNLFRPTHKQCCTMAYGR